MGSTTPCDINSTNVICGFSKEYLIEQTLFHNILVLVGYDNIDFKLYMYPKHHPYLNDHVNHLYSNFQCLYELDNKGTWNTFTF